MFAEHGFAATSMRALTARAGANLGAVTYHFGSKEALYEAVAESLAIPLRERIARVAARDLSPLDRIELSVRELFEHLRDHPDLPRFMVQQLASARPMPQTVVDTLGANHAALVGMIAEGQRDGSVRQGDPRLLALSIVAQPIWMAVVRRALQQAIGIDQEDARTRSELIESHVRFVRSGLAPHRNTWESP
jgi:AcrR family transcriptional regulator